MKFSAYKFHVKRLLAMGKEVIIPQHTPVGNVKYRKSPTTGLMRPIKPKPIRSS